MLTPPPPSPPFPTIPIGNDSFPLNQAVARATTKGEIRHLREAYEEREEANTTTYPPPHKPAKPEAGGENHKPNPRTTEEGGRPSLWGA